MTSPESARGGGSDPRETCRLHAAVEVRRSAIDGRGLFARERLPAGTVVARLGGRRVRRDVLLEMLAAAERDPRIGYVDCISLEAGIDLVLPSGHDIHFGNHGCDPNLWHRDATTLEARRDVEAGEELTIDYATQTDNDDFSMDCNCGATACRGRVTGGDWRLAALRERYGRHWTPALLARIDAASPWTTERADRR